MIKQESIVSQIHSKTTNDVSCMKKAQLNPNDEWYTPYNIISNELSRYGKYFKGKDIICPCDLDIFVDDILPCYSITIEFEPDSSTKIGGLNKVKTISYIPDTNTYYTSDAMLKEELHPIDITDENEIHDILRNRIKCNFLRFLSDFGQECGMKSVTASGFDVVSEKGIRFQDVDYSKYDICITNPPFSLYTEFMKCMIRECDSRKNSSHPFNFILLAPFLNRVTPNVGLNLMLNKCYLGYTVDFHPDFSQPNYDNSFKPKKEVCDWITTYPDAQLERNYRLNNYQSGINYNLYKDDYQQMENMTMKDGTHPIIVKNGTIPDNFYGWMFSPITILEKISFDEFEWYGTNFLGYYNKECPEKNPFNHKASSFMIKHNDKLVFHGIVFRRLLKND